MLAANSLFAMAGRLSWCSASTTVPATSAGAASTTSARSSARGRTCASSRNRSPNTGPASNAANTRFAGVNAVSQVGTVSTLYAMDVHAISAIPARQANASHGFATASGKRSLNAIIQYEPTRNRNATALRTSLDSGERPTPENTCSAFAGVPRCVAEAMNPIRTTLNGSAIIRSMRTEAVRSRDQSRTSASARNATTPAGASEVNRPSEKASNPLVIDEAPFGSRCCLPAFRLVRPQATAG